MSKFDASAVSADVVMDFFANTLPFSDLDRPTLERLARKTSIDFVPKGVKLLSQGETRVDSLRLIQSGGVKLYLTDAEGNETLADFRGEGSAVGAVAIFSGNKASLNAETIEDTFFFRIDAAEILDLIESNPQIASHYLKSFSDAYISRAFTELRRRKLTPGQDSSLTLFTTRVGDLVRREAVTVPRDNTIRQAASMMAERGVGSVLVVDGDDEVLGIVTDKDFRYKVLAGTHPPNSEVENIMSSPVLSVEAHEECFDALFLMMKNQVHHLVVTRAGKTAGLISSHDILVLQGRSPFSLYKDISRENSFEGLYKLSTAIPGYVRTLIEEGAKAGHIGKMISVLNDLILERLLTMLQEELGPPPAAFCWIQFGSEGRKEQAFRTDQDNALIYEDVDDELQQENNKHYFEKFGAQAIEHLKKCGYPPCPAGFMASNPEWVQPYSVWHQLFDTWISRPEPEEVLKATIFFDFRPAFGFTALGERLRDFLVRRAGREDVFLRYLARECLAKKPPLSFFKSLIVEKDGQHKNTLDIKLKGVAVFVDFARVMALSAGLRETNTLDRLALLREGGHIPADLAQQGAEAFELIQQIKLVHHLRLMEQDEEINNNINPADLSELEKRTLKEAFAVEGRLQSYLKDHFRLNL